MSYEYKVVPAPVRGLKAKGRKTAEDRFANALETAINNLASDGWEYIRADTLPSEKREGIMGKTTVFQNMLVFRRERIQTTEALRLEPTLSAPLPLTAPEPEPALEDTSESIDDDEPTQIADEHDDEKPRKSDSPDVAAE